MFVTKQHLRERRDRGQWEEFEEEVGLLLGLEGQEGFELQGEMGKSYGSVLVSSLRFEASAFKREVTFPDAGCWDLMPKISCSFFMCLHLGDT